MRELNLALVAPAILAVGVALTSETAYGHCADQHQPPHPHCGGNGGDPGMPVGGIILWDQGDICPDGYMRVDMYNGLYLVAQAAPGGTGGEIDHQHEAGTLTGGSHRHILEGWNGSFPPVDDNSGGTQFNARTNVVGAGSVSGSTGAADHLPPFINMVLCRKT